MAERLQIQAEKMEKGGVIMLIEAMYTDVVKLDETSVPDGEGGFITEYIEGAVFKAAITLDTTVAASIADAIAQKDVVRSTYNVTTPITAKLKFGDIIKRVDDAKIFRVTGKENTTPTVATFQFNTVKAEEWELPNE